MDQVVNLSSYLLKTTVDTTLSTLKPVVKPVLQTISSIGTSQSPSVVKAPQASALSDIYFVNTDMNRWLTVAGLMGASAVALGAYGAHVVYPKDIPDSRKAQFETANKYHFISSLALLAVPHVRRPNIAGSLFVVGTALFSGGCYYLAIQDDQRLARIVPFGGWTLIGAWLAMMI